MKASEMATRARSNQRRASVSVQMFGTVCAAELDRLSAGTPASEHISYLLSSRLRAPPTAEQRYRVKYTHLPSISVVTSAVLLLT